MQLCRIPRLVAQQSPVSFWLDSFNQWKLELCIFVQARGPKNEAFSGVAISFVTSLPSFTTLTCSKDAKDTRCTPDSLLLDLQLRIILIIRCSANAFGYGLSLNEDVEGVTWQQLHFSLGWHQSQWLSS